MRRAAQKDYTLPESHKQAEKALLEKLDPVRYFLGNSDRLVVGRGNTDKTVSLMELYTEYHSFLISNAVAKVAQLPAFRQRVDMLRHDFDYELVFKENGRGNQEVLYRGIAIERRKMAA